MRHEFGAIARFRVYPGCGNPLSKDRSRYFSVLVFNSRRKLCKAESQLSGRPARHDGHAVVICGRTTRGRKVHPRIGYAFFSLQAFTTEIVAHESVHMAAHFVRVTKPGRLNLDGHPASRKRVNNEELVAYAAGIAADQIVNQANKALN